MTASALSSLQEAASMLTSLTGHGTSAAAYPEFAGSRILLTGVREGPGLAVAQAFARQGARLALHAGEMSPAIDTLSQEAAAQAEVLAATSTLPVSETAVLRFAQTAARLLGGIDAALNMISLSQDIVPQKTSPRGSPQALDTAVRALLTPAALVTRTAANRMRLTLIEGVILNAAIAPAPETPRAEAFLAFFKAALAAMTRVEARTWAPCGIRVNALWIETTPGAWPGDPCTSGAKAAALSLYLASAKGNGLTGCLFDASEYP